MKAGRILVLGFGVLCLCCGCQKKPPANARTPLHDAAMWGDCGRIRTLLAEGMAVDVGDEFGVPPLYHAAREGHKDAAELLIDAGASVQAVRRGGVSPLHEAAAAGHLDVVRLLISKGADVNALVGSDRTPLYDAVRGDYKDIGRVGRDGGVPPPLQTGRADFPHPAFLKISAGGIHRMRFGSGLR